MDRFQAIVCAVASLVATAMTAAKDIPQESATARMVVVNPSESAIVVALPLQGSNKEKVFSEDSYTDAARELQKHIKLISGVEIPIVTEASDKFVFRVGARPEFATEALAEQEACSFVTQDAVYFYADTKAFNRGVEHAVYDFLEEQLGATWIAPGDSGIVYSKKSRLRLTPGKYSWVPALRFRKIRQAWRIRKQENQPIPQRLQNFPEFWPSDEENNQKAEDDMRWQRRMKMGGRRLGGGHAFTNWWDRFGATNPEYFALNRFGKREPVPDRRGEKATKEFVKICPSNPAVAEQIVRDWLPQRERTRYVNAGLNDSVMNFCECEDCKRLDVVLPRAGIEVREPGSFSSPAGDRYVHLTDRYVHLANAVAREVRKHRSDAVVSMYAYLTTLYAPRRLKLEPNVVVHLVPYVIPLDAQVTEELIGGWYQAGAKQIVFRPNYHFKYHPFPMPIGIEKEMFDVFQVASINGCVSAEYDSLMGNWNLTGMSDYILARALTDPSKDFAYWEEKYLSAFGEASEDVKAYFRYWRHTVWEERLKPNLKRLTTAGRSGNFARGLGWAIRSNYIGDYRPDGCERYYTEQDFDITDRILRIAASRELTPAEAKRVEQLMLINKHSRLEHGAMYYRGDQGYALAKELLEFRTKYRHDMAMSWGGVFYVEDVWGDICNLNLTTYLNAYPLPWLKTPFKWRFKMDTENVGLVQNWQQKRWPETTDWKSIRVNVPWSDTYESPHIDLKKRLKTYDGIGWYTFRFKLPIELQQRRVMLYFGGVDDDCTVYVNGQFAGGHRSATVADTNAPFEVQIDQCVDWDAEHQVVMVRVRDKGGRGGVHKETWIVSKEQ